MFAFVKTVGLAEWIIDDTSCLVYYRHVNGVVCVTAESILKSSRVGPLF